MRQRGRVLVNNLPWKHKPFCERCRDKGYIWVEVMNPPEEQWPDDMSRMHMRDCPECKEQKVSQ